MPDYSWGDRPPRMTIRRQEPEIGEAEAGLGWFDWSADDAKFAFILSFAPVLLIALVEFLIFESVAASEDGGLFYFFPFINALVYGAGCLVLSWLIVVRLRWRLFGGRGDRLLFADSFLRTFSLITLLFVGLSVVIALSSPIFLFSIVVGLFLWMVGLLVLAFAVRARESESGGIAVGMGLGGLCGIACALCGLLFVYYA